MNKKHMKHVQQVFQKLQKTGFQIDIDKCEFFVKEIKYLSLIITPEGIKMDQKRFSAVFDWSTVFFLCIGQFFFIEALNSNFFSIISR